MNDVKSDRVVFMPLECLSLGGAARRWDSKQAVKVGFWVLLLTCPIGVGIYFLTTNPLSITIIISIFIWLFLFIFIEILTSRYLRFRHRRSMAKSDDPLVREMVRFADVHQPGIFYKLFRIDSFFVSRPLNSAQTKSLEGMRNARPIPPIVVCDEHLQEKIGMIEPLLDMSEPEALGIGGITRWGVSSLLALIFGLSSSACFLSINVNVGGVNAAWFKVFALVVLFMTIMSTPIQGWILRWWRRDSAQYIVGPGFFTESRGRYFTVADSVMVICKNPREVSTELRVWLVGNGRLRRMKFNSVGDKQFVKLWRFWTCRDPRPELATTMQAN